MFKRLSGQVDGQCPEPEQERLAFVGVPGYLRAMMHMEMPGLETLDKIREYTLKLVKVLQHEYADYDDICENDDTETGIAEISALGREPAE